jgi:3-isopropylmalate/(R)-2-methylmalate dehydratase large subunit
MQHYAGRGTATVVQVAILPSQKLRRKSERVEEDPNVGRTLAEKVWEAHVVRRGGAGEPDLLYIDLHLLHEVTSPQAFDGLRLAGRRCAARPDHRHRGPQRPRPSTSTSRSPTRSAARRSRRCAQLRGVRHPAAPLGDAEQGIVHVIGPQLGLTQPGLTVVCGD